VSCRTQTRVLSISHGAVERDVGRRRYAPFSAFKDVDVHLMAPRRWKEFGRVIHADAPGDRGVRLYLEPVYFAHLPRINWYAHVYPGLRRVLRKVKPDVIHLWEEPWSAVAFEASLLAGNAALVLEVDQNILKRLPQPFEAMRRHVLKRTTAVLSRSQEATVVVRACGFDGPVFPIGYGVDRSVFRPAKSVGMGPQLRIGYVGRLVEEKGLEDVLNAMALARAPVELSLMGDGPIREHLLQRAMQLGLTNRVTVRDRGGAGEVADHFRSVNLSVLMSRTTVSWREQFGRTIIESQACGVPVIGSGSGAIPDVMGRGGWIVPEREPRALAALLDHLFQHPDEIAARGRAGLENISTRFTYEITAAQLREAWREANARRRNSIASKAMTRSAATPLAELEDCT
jgi:glycosyltransferase involved in cell wall biosynthesis